ncbi:DUF6265 family protein [uncultured Flavobacterium sp.]|uniref:DUF6265 family protein n=1 Tax=uncultured Flavobacterium sp. TaxID=165435 RepID=UPI0025FCD672|nr:DUF6265 family protein [uncultured Flavobacterium sp.]
MKKTPTYLISCILISMISCKEVHDAKLPPLENTSKKYDAIENANWLIGRWENNSEEGNLSEFWTRENDSTFHGESYFVIGKDTVFGEKVELMQRGKDFIFEARVAKQNDEKPVPFKLTKSSKTEMVWENPAHDFPNKIVYQKVGKDSLVAEIFGTKDGKPKSEIFKMKKVK